LSLLGGNLGEFKAMWQEKPKVSRVKSGRASAGANGRGSNPGIHPEPAWTVSRGCSSLGFLKSDNTMREEGSHGRNLGT